MTNDQRPEEIFRGLRRSRAAEPDSEALWRRIEARLEPLPPGGFGRFVDALLGASRRPRLRLAGVLAAITAVTVAAVVSWRSAPVAEVAPQVAMQAPVADVLVPDWELDVRLVRGFDGVPPADVRTETVDGAGGASRLADLRSDLASLVRFDDIGLVGEWVGELQVVGSNVPLSAGRALTFEVVGVDTDNGALQLRNVWLEGEERLKVASELTLSPGEPHLIGVRPETEVETRLFLAIDVRPPPVPTTGAADESQE
ncbi:MAG TPA: hypothetical protein QGG47_03780 [Acidobacteriota bacterium]|nr:hypothetical protein [Acidobacteriota bacterium]